MIYKNSKLYDHLPVESGKPPSNLIHTPGSAGTHTLKGNSCRQLTPSHAGCSGECGRRGLQFLSRLGKDRTDFRMIGKSHF